MIQESYVSSLNFNQLAQRFDKPDVVQALILTGSYSRNEAGPYSDIDLVRFVTVGANLSGDGTYLHENDVHINLLTVEPEEYEKWFTDPLKATQWIAGIRIAKAIIDRNEFFKNGLQTRARNFMWDMSMQTRANIEASRRMVGWSEEAQKGLEGLRRNHEIGRLLNACHGLSWGLSEIIQIHRGVLVSSDNNAFFQIESSLEDRELMIKLRRIAFGVMGSYTLKQRVVAGLQLYALLAEQMSSVWQINDAPIIEHTAKQIRNFVPNLFDEGTFNES